MKNPINQFSLENQLGKQPDENELRDKSLKWWVNLGHEQAWTLREKYFPHRSLLTADERLEIYLAEHSSPVPVKDKAVQDNFTEGEWKISGTTRGLNGLYVGTDKQHIAQVFPSIPEYEANARLIAEAKNMYYAMKDLITWQYCFEPRNETEKETFDNCVKEAKAILNRINKQ